MPVTLYGINKYGQEFKSYVVPEEVDFYVKEKGLSTEPIRVVEKEVKKPDIENKVVTEKKEKAEKPIKKSKSE